MTSQGRGLGCLAQERLVRVSRGVCCLPGTRAAEVGRGAVLLPQRRFHVGQGVRGAVRGVDAVGAEPAPGGETHVVFEDCLEVFHDVLMFYVLWACSSEESAASQV